MRVRRSATDSQRTGIFCLQVPLSESGDEQESSERQTGHKATPDTDRAEADNECADETDRHASGGVGYCRHLGRKSVVAETAQGSYGSSLQPVENLKHRARHH